jgi:hypothetical protein
VAIDRRGFEALRQQFAAMRSTMATALQSADAQLTTMDNTLLNWETSPPPITQPSGLRFARHKYDNSTVTDLSLFSLYDLQRGWRPSGALRTGAEIAVYTTIVRRPTDAEGRTQFLRPNLVADTWCVHKQDGSLVTRPFGSGVDTLVNFTHPQWLSLAIPNIVNEAKRAGATIIYEDEVDFWWKYAWPVLATSPPKEFPTETHWRQGMVSFLNALTTEAHRNGLKVWINLGADYNTNDLWQDSLLSTVDMLNIEFYTGREGVGGEPTTPNDGWSQQNEFLAAVEKRGLPVHVHCSSLNQRVVDYAYHSWLLFRQPSAMGTFSAGLGYGDVFGMPSSSVMEKVQALGEPTGQCYVVSSGLYQRHHKNGLVFVNPTKTTLDGLTGQTGRIQLS